MHKQYSAFGYILTTLANAIVVVLHVTGTAHFTPYSNFHRNARFFALSVTCTLNLCISLLYSSMNATIKSISDDPKNSNNYC